MNLNVVNVLDVQLKPNHNHVKMMFVVKTTRKKSLSVKTLCGTHIRHINEEIYLLNAISEKGERIVTCSVVPSYNKDVSLT